MSKKRSGLRISTGIYIPAKKPRSGNQLVSKKRSGLRISTGIYIPAKKPRSGNQLVSKKRKSPFQKIDKKDE